jgi:hypothetical protein
VSAAVLQQLPAEDVTWATLDANLLLLILTPLRASTSLDDRRACGGFAPCALAGATCMTKAPHCCDCEPPVDARSTSAAADGPT